MKIRKKTAKLAAIFAVCMVLSVFAFAADGTYDSTTDPIVAQSYVDSKVAELETKIAALESKLQSASGSSADIEGLRAELETIKKDIAAIKTNNGGLAYTTITLNKNQKLYAGDSALEIIVRSGTASVVSPFVEEFKKQGLSDITTGKELYNGAVAPFNDLLLIPVGGDGRGLEIKSEKAVLLVRGHYEVK